MEVQLLLIVKKKAERTLKLLEEGTIRKEERKFKVLGMAGNSKTRHSKGEIIVNHIWHM